MKVEILYPSFGSLFGEESGYRFLEACLRKEDSNAKIVRTEIKDRPLFADEDVDMIYIGGMTESQQEMAIKALMPFKARLEELIEKNVIILAVSNAMEIFEAYIENEDGSRVEGLGIFSEYAKRKMMARYNSMALTEFEGMKIMGYKTQFTQTFGDNSNEYFLKVIRGKGINPESSLEGLKRNNFMGTYLVGPILILNPDFMIYLMKKLGIKDPHPICEQQLRIAYDERLKVFEDPKTVYDPAH